MSEQDWMTGNRAAWQRILGEAIRELGMSGRTIESLVLEREAAIAKLREVCAEHGDNDWEESLHLSDVIEKHLVRPWEEATTT